MNTDKILELARRYTEPETREEIIVTGVDNANYTMTFWKFCEEELIAFAQAVIEEEEKSTTIRVPMTTKKLEGVNNVSDLAKALKAAEKNNDLY